MTYVLPQVVTAGFNKSATTPAIYVATSQSGSGTVIAPSAIQQAVLNANSHRSGQDYTTTSTTFVKFTVKTDPDEMVYPLAEADTPEAGDAYFVDIPLQTDNKLI